MRSDNSWFECRSTACGGASSVRPREAARRVSEADQVHFHERNALTRHAHRVPWGASKGVESRSAKVRVQSLNSDFLGESVQNRTAPSL